MIDAGDADADGEDHDDGGDDDDDDDHGRDGSGDESENERRHRLWHVVFSPGKGFVAKNTDTRAPGIGISIQG